MALNWHDIKLFNGSQNNAFEELVCQLAREEPIPNKVQFTRVAAPDGGVEAYCLLDNGEEYGWQAKFFSKMEESQWVQLRKSVETALKKHPNLTKYFICIPLDRQDPRHENQSWFMDKWNAKTKEWAETAKKNGKYIDFEYWGSSELLQRLSQESQAGRRYFWFSKDEFSDEWFNSQVKNNILNLGHRYTPQLNFELTISKQFDAIKAIGWLFVSTNIAFRDSATKGLACILVNHITVASDLFRDFCECNDPYVYERILAAIYGAILNSSKLEGLVQFT